MSVSELNEFVADLAREEIGAGPIETVRGGDELQASDAAPETTTAGPMGRQFRKRSDVRSVARGTTDERRTRTLGAPGRDSVS